MTALDATSEQEGELENESFWEPHRCGATVHTSCCQAAALRAHLRPLTLPCSLPLARHSLLVVVSVLHLHPIPNQTFSCLLCLCSLQGTVSDGEDAC